MRKLATSVLALTLLGAPAFATGLEVVVAGEGANGTISIDLFEDVAPGHVAQITALANEGKYDGVVFHRVIDGFMIQGGGFDSDMVQKETRENIENEADNGLSNEVGTIAMARTMDPHSASAQFFINIKDNSFLNHTGKNSQGWGYCVFGKVADGMDVVDQIKAVKTGNHMGHQDVPKEDVIINSVTTA